MTRAIVFDMGGVIVDLDRDLCVRNFKQKAGFADIEDFLNIYHQQGFISDLEEGLITEAEFYDECRKHCSEGTSDKVLSECFSSLLARINPSVADDIRRLSKEYPLYVLSNNNPICTARFYELVEKENLSSCFTDCFFSYKWKLLKPGLPIFRKLVETIGCRPEEIRFYDDADINIEGAKAAGIDAVLYVDGMPL